MQITHFTGNATKIKLFLSFHKIRLFLNFWERNQYYQIQTKWLRNKALSLDPQLT